MQLDKVKEGYKDKTRQELMDEAPVRAKAELREEYKGLSRQELLDKAYQIGFDTEKTSGSCSQATVYALYKLVDLPEVMVRVASSSCGGQASRVQGTCGALIGGTMVMDYFFGRPIEHISHEIDSPVAREDVWYGLAMARLLNDFFIKEWGTIICPQLQEQVLGRCYTFWNPDNLDEFFKAGSCSEPGKCSHIVGSVARRVMEVLLDKGVIEGASKG